MHSAHYYVSMTVKPRPHWRLVAEFGDYSLFHSAPPLRLPMFSLEFRAEVNHEETTIMGLPSSEDPMIVA